MENTTLPSPTEAAAAAIAAHKASAPETTTKPAVAATSTETAKTEAQAPPAAPKVAMSVEAVKAARLAAATAPKTETTAPNNAPPTSSTQKPEEKKSEAKTGEIPVDDKVLARIASLEAENRALKTKSDGVDVKSYERYTAAMKLAKDGKHAQAIEALGLDLSAANYEILGLKPEDAQTDKTDASKDEVIAALTARLEKLESNDSVRTQVDVSAAQESGKAAAIEHVKANAAQFPFLSRSDKWVKSALDNALNAYRSLPEDKRVTSEEDRNAFVLHFLNEAEKERAEDAKLLAPSKQDESRNTGNGAVSTTQSGNSSSTPNLGDLNRGVTTPVIAPKKMSYADVKRLRRQAQ